ncbi:MAG: flavin reductase family protein [Cyclobacteriaceae bacterium]
MQIDPKNTPVPELHGYLLGAVAPRPIAFASTVDKQGNINLSPFSFFNVFSANPPIMIFSPARRGRDKTTKHTYQNVNEHPEVVINVVSHSMVEQMSLSSTEYEKGVNEFVKSGFTEVRSEMVSPPRVKESPVSFECKVIEVRPLGDGGGAGNLVICEVLMIHIKNEILTDGKIDPNKIDLVGRMGGNWYSRASGDDIFEVAKPLVTKGIGVDQIPANIRNSTILTGNNLGQLGNVEKLPSQEEVEQFASEPEVRSILDSLDNDDENRQIELHRLAAKYLAQGGVLEAWKVLLQP